MKLINSFGPNPRVVRMFLLEKGVDLPREEIDIMAGDNYSEEYLARNPTGLSPSLELDDGEVIGETVAICELVEELYPEPPLIGLGGAQRAKSRMWYRRVELGITEHMYHGFRYGEGHERFKDLMICIPEASEGLKAKGRDKLGWLDKQLEGKHFIAGATITLADIILYCCMDFLKDLGQPLDPELPHVGAWFERMRQRPSAAASLHEQASITGWAG